MKFGFMLGSISQRHFGVAARLAESAGFDSVWIPEHLVMPPEMPTEYPYSTDGRPPITVSMPLYDPFAVLSYIAATTSSILLGTNVYLLPLRHPLLTARSAVTVDRLSGGRLLIGAGVGWLQDEFRAVEVPFAERGRRTDEIIPLLRRLWSEEIVAHDGPAYRFDAVRFEPKPRAKPSIPILIGGSSRVALRRAGTLGDGWIEIGSDLGQLRTRIDTIRRHREAAGRTAAPFDITVNPPDRSLALTDDTVGELADLGVTRIMVHPRLGRTDEAELAEWIDQFADRHHMDRSTCNE